jgi:hypothetical protein
MAAKRGTVTPGWFKPDLIAVASSVGSVRTYDQKEPGGRCYSTLDLSPEPVPDPYRGAAGTSFAAPMALGAGLLAARRYSATPGEASPPLIKAMLVAGARSMSGGRDRARFLPWKKYSSGFVVGDQVVPRTPNGRYYEVIARINPDPTEGTGGEEPDWPEANDATVDDGAYRWRNQGSEPLIGPLPNDRQGFGRLHLEDVLSATPARVYVNNASAAAGSWWSQRYSVDDPALPVRIALAWSDPPPTFNGAIAPDPLLVNNLDLSVEVMQNGQCMGRHVGNRTDGNEESVFYQPCQPNGNEDVLNNVEVIRFTPSADRASFRVRVAYPAQGRDPEQNFSLVVWNAKGPPPAMPAGFAASSTSASAVQLTWTAVAGASAYEVERSTSMAGPFSSVTCAASGCTDSGLAPGTTYLYRVRASGIEGVSEWALDAARTVVYTDPVLTAGTTTVKDAHVTELRQAVNALRAAVQLSAFSWTDAQLAPGTLIRAVHIAELRIALHEARAVLGVPALTYTDPALVPEVTRIKVVHINELREGSR